MFCEQKDDELGNIKMMQENDFKNWNVHRVVKSESDVSKSPPDWFYLAKVNQICHRQKYKDFYGLICRACI